MSTAPETQVPSASLRALLALAIPMVLTRSTQAVDTFADTYMVKDLGEDAIAATATGGLNSFAAAILFFGTVFIVQSFVAQRVGRGERDKTRRYAFYGLALAGAAQLLALAFIPFTGRLLGLAGYEADVHSQMTSYLDIRLLSIGAAVGCEAIGNFYGGLGNTWMQLVASVIQMVINVAWNYVFIEGRFGAPALGVDGAAWSSVVSTWAGFAFLAIALWRGWGNAPKRGTSVDMSWRELRRVVRFGLPNGFNWFLEFAAFQLFINAFVSDLGTSGVAAFNVVIAINSVSFMPAFGIATAGAILAGQTIGAGFKDAVWPQVKLTLACTAIWMGVIGALYLVAPSALIGLFAPDGESAKALIETGTIMLIMSALWQLFDSMGMTLSETLRAAGDTTWTAGARIILAWAVFMPASYLAITVAGGGAIAAMACLAGYIALLAIALALRFKSGKWKQIELIEPDLLPEPSAPVATAA
jgi:MATE family multidrug resistance protein